jgi:hypothetical protein
MSDQITREEALERLKIIAYPSVEDLENDKRYFLKKMKWEPEDLDKYLNRSEVLHNVYPSEETVWELIIKVARFIKGKK